jgi:uncharacterized protein YjdB
MSVGGSVRLEATTKDASGNVLTGRSVAWSSNRPDIADVDQSGNVTGVAPGTATITAQSEGKLGTATITITTPPVASIVVTPQPATVKSGNAITLTASCRDEKGDRVTGVPVSWSTTAPSSLLTFGFPTDSTIRIQTKSKKTGTAVFTAGCGGRSTQATVRIDD